MGTGGGREADKLHSMEKKWPSGLEGNTAQNLSSGVWGFFAEGYEVREIRTRVLRIFLIWVRIQDYHSLHKTPKHPPPIACSTVSLPTLPQLIDPSSLARRA